MGSKNFLFSPLFIVLVLLFSGDGAAADRKGKQKHFNKNSFPDGFIFGSASAAYQYEGGAKEGGRGPSIWDNFTHQYPWKIKDRSNGDVAIDSYHRYEEDVNLLKKLGFNAYRFSISWSRILPEGTVRGVNQEGIKYYNNLINKLLSEGISPFVTLFHWDLPQALQDEYGGFLSSKIVEDFHDYADLCFKEFGDRVKHWITINEPLSVSAVGFNVGVHAPGRCSPWVGNCTGGDSGTEPYIVSHNILLAHAAAARLYKKKYQVSQKGTVGITLNCDWIIPFSDSKADKDAAQRSLDFSFGWYMDPLTHGEYPETMRDIVGDRLPKFTKEQSDMVKGSFDFIGVNYYTASYCADAPPNTTHLSYSNDIRCHGEISRNGIPIGPSTASSWLYVYPKGIQELVNYTKTRYNDPVIYITENGVSELNVKKVKIEHVLHDNLRVKYYRDHLKYLRRAIRDGVKVKGYFAWSLLDNFEWADGYTVRFGINYVDYENGLKRYRKKSSYWFEKFLKA
ncbi:beta-glucosidase 13-like [Aristolochia californica]|uniref:beta-glucosidase 13-like n=1 Tax=Aristolochia californica TaxID=171875 RepID=UPI0035D59160